MSHAVPVWLNVVAIGGIPVAAFALPLLLLRRLPPARRRPRLNGMMIAAFPVIVAATMVGTWASGSWWRELPADTTYELPTVSRYPESLGALAIRSLSIGLGSFAAIWIAGWAMEKACARNEAKASARAKSATDSV